MKAISLVLGFSLVLSISAVCLWSDAKAHELSDQTRAQVVRMLQDLNDGKDVECERIVRLLLGIGSTDEIDSRQIAILLGVDDAGETACETILRTLLGLDAGETIDNRRLVRLLLGVPDDVEVDNERIAELAISRTGRCSD